MKLDRIIAIRNNKIVYRDGDKCIKVFCSRCSKADILNEALNQARISETDLNIPKIHEVTTIDGKWAIVSEFIKGKTLLQMINEDNSKVDEYLEMLINIQNNMNSKKSPLLTKLNDKAKRLITLANLDNDLKERLIDKLNNIPEGDAICHGDFGPSNIILSENNIPYIIDWSHATQGNPLLDCAKTYLMLNLSVSKEIGEKYLSLYCEKHQIKKENVLEYLPIVSAIQLVRRKESEKDILLNLIKKVK